MKFSDFILADAIITDLKVKTKEEVVREIVQSLSDAHGIPEQDKDSVVESILRREEQGSTALGNGFATPHARHVCVDRLIGAVAISHGEGIDFGSIDDDKTNLFITIVSPPDSPSEHLRALEYIAKKFKVDGFVSRLKQAKSREEVLELLKDADQ